MPRPISATVSLPSLRHNLAIVRHKLNSISSQNNRKSPFVWAVIKANAYGHGIANAVKAFSNADGLAMLDIDEAILSRQAGWQGPILLLEGFFQPEDIQQFEQHRLHATVHCFEQLEMLERVTLSRPLDIFIKLNTGMNRLGFSADQFPRAWSQATRLAERGVVGKLGKMTHFARADEISSLTQTQISSFIQLTGHLPGPSSICNSAATLTPECWLSLPDEQEQWVRPGICLYGSSPFALHKAAQLDLRPAMTLRSQVISVRRIDAGEGVGYGHRFIADQPLTVGVVACGYADGYPRHAPTGTPVAVKGVMTRLLGRVSMDMLAVDLTPVPGPAVGDSVVLWGEGGPSVDDVAEAAGTIGYELLCAVAPRVQKLVIDC